MKEYGTLLIGNENLYDGPAMVSTGVDNRDGNTVGDDCKSSKKRKCKRRYIRLQRNELHW
jgi:hypothetical protein